MTMRLTMVNLVVAKGSRNQSTTSLRQNTLERRSKHKTYYITVGIREVRPPTCNYEAALLVGKFPHRFSLSFFSLSKFIEVLN